MAAGSGPGEARGGGSGDRLAELGIAHPGGELLGQQPGRIVDLGRHHGLPALAAIELANPPKDLSRRPFWRRAFSRGANLLSPVL